MSAVLEDKPAMTVTEAVGKARWFRAQPEVILDDRTAKRIIDTLLSALEVSPPYLASVQQGEPVFVLRGQDVLAPALVRRWADDADSHGCHVEKIDEARAKAVRMESWTPRKYPD